MPRTETQPECAEASPNDREFIWPTSASQKDAIVGELEEEACSRPHRLNVALKNLISLKRDRFNHCLLGLTLCKDVDQQ